jgi:hypothetical protein
MATVFDNQVVGVDIFSQPLHLMVGKKALPTLHADFNYVVPNSTPYLEFCHV